MSQLFEVRPATDADVVPRSESLNACTLVHQGVSRSSPADVAARLHFESSDPRLDSFVAAGDDGAIVGFAHLWAVGADEVKLFARTHPEARGRGVGSRLIWLCDRLMLDVDAENTTSALRLYERAGMTPRPAFTIWEKRPGSAVPRRP